MTQTAGESDSLTPVTIITGFLGAGKSTLLDYILHNNSHGKRIAVINNELATPIGAENEFQAPVDSAVFVAEIMETTSGCLCCSGRGNFVQLLHLLAENRSRFDYLIVETDGLSDPTFTNIFFEEPTVRKNFSLDGIVTLVDAQNIQKHLDTPKTPEYLNEALEQIGAADRIIVNKTDLVPDAQVKAIISRIQGLNSEAKITTAKHSQVDLDFVLAIKAFDLNKMLAKDPEFLELRPDRRHDPAIGTMVLVTNTPIVDLEVFKGWLKNTLLVNSIVRSKGVINFKGEDKRLVFQGVNNVFDIRTNKPWPTASEDNNNTNNNNNNNNLNASEAERLTRVVLIGKNLRKPEILESFKTTLGIENVKEEIPFQTGLTRRPPTFNFLILFGVTLLLFCPDEISRTLTRLPFSSYTGLIVTYRWAVLLVVLVAWMFFTRSSSSPARVSK